VRWWDRFKPKPETPAVKQALANLDEVSREVAWGEEDREFDREHGIIPAVDPDPAGGPSMRDVMHGAHVPEPVADPDPASPGGLRDALQEGEEQK
jgi:hypothetical protein